MLISLRASPNVFALPLRRRRSLLVAASSYRRYARSEVARMPRRLNSRPRNSRVIRAVPLPWLRTDDAVMETRA